MRELTEKRLVLMLLVAATVASGVWLINLDSQLTFITDDWALLVQRQGSGADYYLQPFHGNVVVVPRHTS